MHSEREGDGGTALVAFVDLRPGRVLRPLQLAVSAAANERYWRAAGVDHPSLRAGCLYPMIAANLTILAFQQHCGDAVIQTRQHLQCHRTEMAGIELVVTATVTARYEKRGREYVDIDATVTTADRPREPLWTSGVTFTPAATVRTKR